MQSLCISFFCSPYGVIGCSMGVVNISLVVCLCGLCVSLMPSCSLFAVRHRSSASWGNTGQGRRWGRWRVNVGSSEIRTKQMMPSLQDGSNHLLQQSEAM